MKAIFVIGRIASGKSTYTNSIKTDSDLVIELGDIVREIKGTNKRFFDAGLNSQICDNIKTKLEHADCERVILASARSLSLIEDIERSMNFDSVEYHIMSVPYSVCKVRFEQSKRDKDTELTYDEALKGDASIGMEDLMFEMCAREGDNVKIIENY